MKQNYCRVFLVLGSLVLVVSSALKVNAQEPQGAKRPPVPGDGRRRPAPEAVPPSVLEKPTRDAVETPVYELRCRGGENAFQIEDAGIKRDDRGAQPSSSKIHVVFMKFNEAYGYAAG